MKHHILIKSIIITVLVSIFVSTAVFAQADNPLFRTFRSADSNPLVYNGRFYIVCGQDEVNTNAFNMYAWRLMSSADMETWTDHGVIARPADYSWMPSNRAWASTLVYRNGMFYFYIATDWAVGVLTATSITGPYTDPLGHALINSSTPNHSPRDIDPMCFIDDDGQAYLFWGGDGGCRYARLNSDMISLAFNPVTVSGLTSYLEAPFIIKTNGYYFLMYADQPWPSEIRYATASSISGPWTYRGIIGTPTGTGTNHEGAAYFNGQWWYTYHTEELSNGNPYSRCVCVDPMTINGNTINKINYSSFWMYTPTPTPTATPGGPTPTPTPTPTTGPTTTPGSGPVVWYKLDETSGTTAADSSGNGKNGTLVNSPTWVVGKSGNAVNLDGSNDYVSMLSGIVSGLNDFTIAAWVKQDALKTWSRIFDIGTGTTVNMFLTPSGGGTIRFAITTGGGSAEQRINGTATLPTGTWKHVAVTLAGNTGRLYVDGAQVGQNTNMTLRPSSLGSTTQNWIGRSMYSADPYLDGQVDAFRIYNRALSAAEVNGLFTSGN